MLKNENGMALFFVLVIGAVVIMSGITLWQVSTTDTIQVERDEDSAQAYYYAKSGVEVAVGKIIKNGPEYLLDQDDPVKFYGSFDVPFFSSEPENPPIHNIEFEIKRENNDFSIESTGIVRKGSSEGAQVASNAVGYTITVNNLFESGSSEDDDTGGALMPPLDMIFALESIDLSGSSEIHGDTGTNSTAPGSVELTYSTMIRNGDLYIGPGVYWEEGNVVIFHGYNRSPATNIPNGVICNLLSTRNYPMPQFPDIPTGLDSKGEINAGWGKSPDGGYRISESGSYTSINVQKSLTIDVGDEDILIKTQNLNVTGSGEISINKTGSGRIILYVEDTFSLTGSSKINHGGSYDDVYMYYLGESFGVGGATEFVGSVYALDSDFAIKGSGGVKGHIITGGEAVDVTGDATANARTIYAPNATFNITGSGSMRGVLVAKTIDMVGNARIYYDDSMNMNFFEQLDWNLEDGSNDKKPVVDSKKWWENGQWENL